RPRIPPVSTPRPPPRAASRGPRRQRPPGILQSSLFSTGAFSDSLSHITSTAVGRVGVPGFPAEHASRRARKRTNLSRHASSGWRGALPSWRLPATIVLPAGPGIRQGVLMNEDEILPSRDVVLGFNGAVGFAPADLTSPALAAAAGALVDVTLAGAPGSGVSATGQPVTELRVHGVSGSDGPTMLEHPAALQVAGDKVTGFYRRWS